MPINIWLLHFFIQFSQIFTLFTHHSLQEGEKPQLLQEAHPACFHQLYWPQIIPVVPDLVKNSFSVALIYMMAQTYTFLHQVKFIFASNIHLSPQVL